jgi:hypothetical protein
LGGHVVEILSLSSSSPCLDAGNNSLLLEDLFDLNGNSNIEEPKPYDLHYLCQNQSYWIPRIVNGTVDMGAYELGPQCAGADWDEDGTVTVADIFAFLSDWFANDPKAQCFGATMPPTGCGVPAIFAFLSAWFAGCA